MMLGEHTGDCEYPNLRWYDPLPLPPGQRVRVTFWGQFTVPRVTIIQGRVFTENAIVRQTPCTVVADIVLDRSVPIGYRSDAVFHSPVFGYSARWKFVAGAPTPATPTTAVTPPITSRSPSSALPDLAPVAGLGGGPVLRFSGPNSRRINDLFCQSLPTAAAGEAPTAVITLAAALTWSVTNTGTGPAGGPFTAELRNNANQALLQSVTINGLSAGEQRSFQYSRSQTQTRVIRVTAQSGQQAISLYGGTGCFQAILPSGDPMDWRDPLFRVVVDGAGAITEGGAGKGNNVGVF
jgi:hypothetical protein